MLLHRAFWLASLAALVFAGPLWAQGRTEASEDRSEAGAEADPRAPDDAAKGGGAERDASAAETGADEPVGPAVDGATYLVRMRDLELRVDQLKEQIRRSYTRLSLLSETVLAGGVGGSHAQVDFTNDLSGAFRIERLLVVLDGAVQYNKQDTSASLAKQDEFPVFSGSVPPGDHTLQVLVRLRGHGYGVFSYLRGYKFEVKSAHSFTVTEGKTIEINIIVWEKGGVTTPLEQRPAIRYVERLRAGGVSATSAKAKRSSRGSGASGSISVGTGGS
jgi:hypothetical protein